MKNNRENLFSFMMKMKTQTKSTLMLLTTSIIWGFAFVAQSVGMDHIGPYTFMTFRFILASFAMLPLMHFTDKRKNKETVTKEKKEMIKPGIYCGLALFFGSMLQQIGIMSTSVGKAGFITALYIVMVPIIEFVIYKKWNKSIIFSVVLAVIGLYLLCINESLTIASGDFFELLGAVAFAIQIIIVDKVIQRVDGIKLSFMQYVTCACCSCVMMLFFEEISFYSLSLSLIPILYAGLCSNGIGNTLQVLAQKGIDATVASLIMSLESVFSAIAGALLLHQFLSVKELCGCILMFTAIILVQLPTKKEA